jgi:glycerol dehydrogenase-like iron-containing ADH family enzyme
VGSRHYAYEVNGVVVDTAVIAAQPVRLFLAGVFDALAKFVEIKQRFNEETTEYPIGLDYAYIMSKYSYKLLNEKTQKCLDDMEKDVITDDLENIIFTTIAATGNISGIARGSNQSALAHKFYYATRTLFPESSKLFLHGEIVGIGLVLQNHFNGEEENNKYLLELMKNYNMPCSLEDVGIEKTEEVFNKYYEIISSDISTIANEEECKKFKESLRYMWEVM